MKNRIFSFVGAVSGLPGNARAVTYAIVRIALTPLWSVVFGTLVFYDRSDRIGYPAQVIPGFLVTLLPIVSLLAISISLRKPLMYLLPFTAWACALWGGLFDNLSRGDAAPSVHFYTHSALTLIVLGLAVGCVYSLVVRKPNRYMHVCVASTITATIASLVGAPVGEILGWATVAVTSGFVALRRKRGAPLAERVGFTTMFRRGRGMFAAVSAEFPARLSWAGRQLGFAGLVVLAEFSAVGMWSTDDPAPLFLFIGVSYLVAVAFIPAAKRHPRRELSIALAADIGQSANLRARLSAWIKQPLKLGHFVVIGATVAFLLSTLPLTFSNPFAAFLFMGTLGYPVMLIGAAVGALDYGALTFLLRRYTRKHGGAIQPSTSLRLCLFGTFAAFGMPAVLLAESLYGSLSVLASTITVTPFVLAGSYGLASLAMNRIHRSTGAPRSAAAEEAQ